MKQDSFRAHKAASQSVVDEFSKLKDELPFEDTADFDDARRGFIGTREHARVRRADGSCTWDLEPFSFLDAEEPAPTVNPSLWRQARLNMEHGLFEVVPGVYQVRGFDIANMTLIEGDKGVIVVDCLMVIDSARTGIELYFEHRGKRPITGVIFTHTHEDHWGGTLGVLTEEEIAAGEIPIIAPDQFIENAVSENIIAGPAMRRRILYQVGMSLEPSIHGLVDCGLGKAVARGPQALVRPNDLIMETGDTRTIDGVEFEFQMAPDSEAPAEMHFYAPKYKLLNLAENCTHTFHNLLPFRGAEVRNPLAWSYYLTEALELWGTKADVVCGQHHWPVWGNDRVVQLVRQQRDLYKYVHDQTLRLINHGLTAEEIAETLTLPRELDHAWHLRGYYGHLRHNVKAIYQKYLGWYDANPANLNPLPRIESGRKYIEYMGGAKAVLERARSDMEAGSFRWVSQVLSHLVFAEPDNTEARALLADAFEQLGYLAESANWRNAYLFGALELRNGAGEHSKAAGGLPNSLGSLSTRQVWDVLSVRVNGPKAEAQKLNMLFRFTDTEECLEVCLESGVLTYGLPVSNTAADARYEITRGDFNDLLASQGLFSEAAEQGRIKAEGDPSAMDQLIGLLDQFEDNFGIVEPRSLYQPS
ncbi:alkyl/aryl-sulfatase [Sinisalibacter aestuarii]|uniref:Alkyl sulfatase n=1 Tax=Sinisalibacter aestuarii TaxID=2949426 RepID=A0ABQ5LY49_9RHOB|nr:alkyl sulfatase dimerization domain-containing protein [Sinisalibacter aestuarii]GKY89899.1 alkyl sulfatase [Sinisalibacter aestuarii]